MKLSKTFAKRLLSKLTKEEKELIKSRKELEAHDSFADITRVSDNANPDIEVDEQNFHEKTEVLRMAVDRNITQIRRAVAAIKKGKYGKCDICGGEIPPARLRVFPTATLCTECRAKKELEKQRVNRKKSLLTSR
ncbi:MAG: TraR/DksA family transcriptional regulator [bacterium]